MMRRLAPFYDLPFDRHCKHEFVLSGRRQKKLGVRTLDIAKRLLDFGYHPPTIYFPLNVEECIMIEPTETESKETLDGFIDKMIQIAKEVEENPEVVQEAPHTTVIKRLDETMVARKPVLRYAKASSCTSLIRITKEELAEAGFCMDICPALTDSKLPTQNLAGEARWEMNCP